MNATPGRLFVIAAPSGAGKTSLVKALLQRRPELVVSISHTTRPRRPAEVEGRDYFFIEVPTFQRMKADNAFLECAQVFDNFYGTSRAQVESRLAAGEDVVLEIDWQGARQIRAALPAAQSIFILPPSRAALEQRLRTRQSDSEAVIARRLADAAGDIGHWAEFTYVVINDTFEHALADLERIVAGDGAALVARRPEVEALAQQLEAEG